MHLPRRKNGLTQNLYHKNVLKFATNNETYIHLSTGCGNKAIQEVREFLGFQSVTVLVSVLL